MPGIMSTAMGLATNDRDQFWISGVSNFPRFSSVIATEVDSIGYDNLKPNRQLPPFGLSLTAFPNPFNASIHIQFEVAQSGWTSVSLYDILGRETQMLFSGRASAGRHDLTFNGNKLGSGSYWIVAKQQQERRVLTIKLIK
jgi:aspartyl-tRNA synthetase